MLVGSLVDRLAQLLGLKGQALGGSGNLGGAPHDDRLLAQRD